mmetsp:Transcript_28839/g.28546  ORF Transcript_28839/g.28546 Transcript_28839/m.28546 type:complete len:85 (+) Transcript_28839:3-257(+)
MKTGPIMKICFKNNNVFTPDMTKRDTFQDDFRNRTTNTSNMQNISFLKNKILRKRLVKSGTMKNLYKNSPQRGLVIHKLYDKRE